MSIIFVSSLNRPEDEAAGLEAGAADHIAKPFNATVVQALREAADVRLYRAKQGGRNRVMWRSENLSTG